MRMKLPLFLGLVVSVIAILSIPSVLAATPNLVPNPSVDISDNQNPNNPQDWITDQWGTNTSTFSRQSIGHTDNNSIKVETTNYTNGDAKWYYTPQPAEAGATYTVSDFYQSNVQSRVVIMFNLTNGTQKYVELATAAASPSTWKMYSKTVIAPANTVSMSVFHLISRVGWLITDDYSVTLLTSTPTPTPTATPSPSPIPTSTPSPTPTNTPTPTTTSTPLPTNTPSPTPTATPTPTPSSNVIPNPSLETENNTVPKNWVKEKWGSNKATFSYIKNGGHNGNHSIKVQLTNYVDGDAKWYFNPVSVTPGDTYTVTDWYQSNIVSHVVIDFAKTDGSHYYLELRTAPVSSSWKKFSESFQVPYNSKTMTVLHFISGNGWITTDDYSLIKTNAQGFSRPLVTFAFDDGWEDDSINALPILNSYGYKGTFFFATSFLESSPVVGPIGVSGPTTVKEMFNQGYEIGGHSVTHPDLTTLNNTDLTYELTHSKNYLESLVGVGKILNFATPFGAYNDTMLSTLRPLYRSQRPTDEGFNTKDNLDAYKLKVQNMQKTTTLAEYTSWINQAVKDKSWLILVYHRVANSDLDQFDTPLADFPSQMSVVNHSGITVKTMNQALDEVLSQ